MFRSAIFVTALSLLLSVVGFISQVLIAKYFGAGHLLDIFLTISSLPTLFAAVISSAMSYSLTPTMIDAKNRFVKGYDQFLGSFLISLTSLAAILAMVGCALVYCFLGELYKFITITERDTALVILVVSWLTVIGTVLNGFFTSQFNANQKFLQPVLLSFLPYLLAILFVVILNNKFGIVSISLGIFIGTISSVVISYLILKREISFIKASDHIRSSVNAFFRQIPIAALAMLCFTIYQSIDAFWAPKLGPSNLSYLGYCQRLLIAVGAIVITGPSTVLVPRLTQAVIDQRNTDFLDDVSVVIKIIIALASMMAVIGSLLATDIIRVMFARGAFTELDVKSVAQILPLMLVGMVFMLCVVIMFRMLFVKKEIKFVAILGILSALLYFTLSGLAVSFGNLKTVGLAYIFTWLVLFLTCIGKLFAKEKAMFFNKANLVFIYKQLFILLLIGAATFGLKSLLTSLLDFSLMTNSILIFGLCGLISTFFYIILSVKLIKQSEIIFLFNGILNMFRKPKIELK